MRRVVPSVMAREQLQQLFAGGVDRESNIVSALVETVTRLVVQELVVRYVTTEELTNDFINAISQNKGVEFRRPTRSSATGMYY